MTAEPTIAGLAALRTDAEGALATLESLTGPWGGPDDDVDDGMYEEAVVAYRDARTRYRAAVEAYMAFHGSSRQAVEMAVRDSLDVEGRRGRLAAVAEELMRESDRAPPREGRAGPSPSSRRRTRPWCILPPCSTPC